MTLPDLTPEQESRLKSVCRKYLAESGWARSPMDFYPESERLEILERRKVCELITGEGGG